MKKMVIRTLAVTLFASLALCGGLPSTGFKNITPQETAKRIAAAPVVLVDVRTVEEFESGHLENAILMPVAELAENIGKLDAYKNSEIIVYCRSGNRSVAGSNILIKNGFNNVSNMTGGIKEWNAMGGKVIQ